MMAGKTVVGMAARMDENLVESSDPGKVDWMVDKRVDQMVDLMELWTVEMSAGTMAVWWVDW